jgi:hypothetical protein
MVKIISDECISVGVCVSEYPNKGILADDLIFVFNPQFMHKTC